MAKKRSPEEEALARIEQAEQDGSTTFHLSLLGLTTLPPEIGRLTNLRELRLQHNRLTSLPPEIGRLTHLEQLLLYNNRLSSVPPSIWGLTKLTRLHLEGNTIPQLPPGIGNLHCLTILGVDGRNIPQLAEEIAGLPNLRRLDLSHTSLTVLPPEIGRLTNLTGLELGANELTSLPPELGRLTKLTTLNLDENPLSDPPPEVVEQGTEAVLAYLRGRLEQSRQQWTAKLLVVGEGGVGKTCLLDALHRRDFDAQSETTHGINVEPLDLPHPTEDGVTMTLNAWDFGGQQIYHATHQFFLTNRSLFVLAWNARLGWKQGRLNYWLETIHALAPDSPVLLVATHIDERTAELPYDDLRRKYPQLVDRCEISSKPPREGIGAFRDAVARAAAGLPLMGVQWPASWVKAAEAVRARPENQITAAELMDLFSGHGVADDGRGVLAKALHELGDILHFDDDDDELGETVLLNPEWVTNNVSNVLECEQIEEGEGIFRREHMADVWKGLDATTREHFLRLMERFDLSYRIPDDREDRSLVVERLSQDPPPYEEQWDAILQTEGCKEISMQFDLGIPRPAGIPTWFIARSHRFTTHTHWLYGALFADERNKEKRKHLALVLAPPADDQLLTLTVRGPSPYSFFNLLKDGLELTFRRFEGLNIERTIPCPGHDNKDCPHAFDFAHLESAVEREPPVHELQCPVGFANIPVSKLLFGIHWSTLDELLRRIDELKRLIASEHETLVAKLDKLGTELEALRQLTQREFTSLFNRDQRLAESHCPTVFSLRPAGGKRWPARDKLLGTKWKLQLYCEYPGCWHPTRQGGEYPIKNPAEWLNTLAPHVQRLMKVFKFVAPILGPWVALSAPAYAKLLETEIDLMGGLLKAMGGLEVEAEHDLGKTHALRDTGGRKQVEGASLRGLRKLLDELDKTHHWGGLKKVLTPEGHYLWLCEHHTQEYRL